MQTKPDGSSSKRSKAKPVINGICGCSNPSLLLSISWIKARSSKIPKNHLKDTQEAILSVDRYSAYKALAKDKDGSIRLSFCWAHMRRDFLNLAKDWPKLGDWAMGWVKEIGTLYHLNERRLELGGNSHQLPQAEKRLQEVVDYMSKQCEKQSDAYNIWGINLHATMSTILNIASCLSRIPLAKHHWWPI